MAQQIAIAIPIVVAQLRQNIDMDNLGPKVGDKRKRFENQTKGNDERVSKRGKWKTTRNSENIVKKGSKPY